MSFHLKIEAERLILRPLVAGDEEVFVSFLMDQDFMQYSRAGSSNESVARIAFAKRLVHAADQFSKLAVIERSTGQIIGYCGVEVCELEGKRELELGYRLTSKARGRGYATEAAGEVLDYYRRQGTFNIIAYTAPENSASQNVLGKLGFKAIKSSEIDSFPIIVFRR